jgi:general secretion pathway protein G
MHRKGLKRTNTMNDSPIRRGHLARRPRDRRALHTSGNTPGTTFGTMPASSPAILPGLAARRTSRRAFSLLELTLVLAIIAALMGVAAFTLLGQGTAAKITTSKASMRILQTAIGQYQLNLSVYPDSLNSLVTAKYVEPRSMVDSWKRPFYFRTPGLGGREFTLLSGGPDGDLNTPADNIDVWTIDAPAPGGQ